MLRANQTYTYDFQLALPVNLPNSLNMSTGKVEYSFVAGGKRTGMHLDLHRERVVEIYQSLPPAHPHCIYPLQISANFENALNYVIQIPRKAFQHGSPIPVTIKMTPLPGVTTRWNVKEMNMKVKEYFCFISPGKGMKHEKRTLVDAKQGSGSWPVQAGPVERTLSVSIPANAMTTVDTELVKCHHKLKLMFSIVVNGSTRKLPAEFDLYIPGPFPPGQGPAGVVMPATVPLLPSPSSTPGHPPPAQIQPYIPVAPAPVNVQPHQQPGMPVPNPYAIQGQVMMTSPHLPGYSPSAQSTLPSYPQTPYIPFSSPLTPNHSAAPSMPLVPAKPPISTPVTPNSIPSVANPYSPGYPTPAMPHGYPIAMTSQGYPAPSMPVIPSPNMGSYPLPPSPAFASTVASPPAPSPSMVHTTMPVPSPALSAAAAAVTSATGSTTTTTTSPTFSRVSTIMMSPSLDPPAPPPEPFAVKLDEKIKFNFVYETIKVDVDDIKTPVVSAVAASTEQATPVGVPPTAPVPTLSRNPQQRHSFTATGESSETAALETTEPRQWPLGPQAIVEGDHSDQQAYRPPPPTTPTPSSVTIAAATSTSVVADPQQGLLNSFNQLNLSATSQVPPPIPPPPPPSVPAQTLLMTTPIPPRPTHLNSMDILSPQTAAATGAVIASQLEQLQQQQQQQQQQQ
ncbi:hypothetical protein BGW38_006017, partial [Lunasporangiospora selenospora]